jgi:glutamate-1-semialdehyde 2,1-aminomutase
MRVYDSREKNSLGHSGTFNNNTFHMTAGYTGLAHVYTPKMCHDFSAVGVEFRDRPQDLSQGTKMTVTSLETILGIQFLQDGKKELRNCRYRKEDTDAMTLFWLEMMEGGFWITQLGSVAVILDMAWEELERLVDRVGEFLERY